MEQTTKDFLEAARLFGSEAGAMKAIATHLRALPVQNGKVAMSASFRDEFASVIDKTAEDMDGLAIAAELDVEDEQNSDSGYQSLIERSKELLLCIDPNATRIDVRANSPLALAALNVRNELRAIGALPQVEEAPEPSEAEQAASDRYDPAWIGWCARAKLAPATPKEPAFDIERFRGSLESAFKASARWDVHRKDSITITAAHLTTADEWRALGWICASSIPPSIDWSLRRDRS